MTDDKKIIQNVYASMAKTLRVMIDRSMWFHPSYESLASNNFEALTNHERRLQGQEAIFCKPLIISFGYAQIIFLCTAVEIFFLHHYMNSIYFYTTINKGDVNNLHNLKRWITSGRKTPDWNKWIKLNSNKRQKDMKGMSFSNLSVANSYFEEIYGKACLQEAIGKKEYKVFLKQFENMQVKRNGIIHRGGELKDGTMINIVQSDMKEFFETSKIFQENLNKFSNWCQNWWINGI